MVLSEYWKPLGSGNDCRILYIRPNFTVHKWNKWVKSIQTAGYNGTATVCFLAWSKFIIICFFKVGFSADATLFWFNYLFFCPRYYEKKPPSKVAQNSFFLYCQPALTQPKSQFLFNKNWLMYSYFGDNHTSTRFDFMHCDVTINPDTLNEELVQSQIKKF